MCTWMSGYCPAGNGLYKHLHTSILGMVELCAKNLQIMRNDFTDYARTFCQIFANYAHFLRIMRKVCATILKIMRALSHFFANYAHLPRKVVNNDVSSELPTISK